jgi:DNA-binding response OmpR family regulator
MKQREAHESGGGVTRVLIVSDQRSCRDRLARRLAPLPCVSTGSLEEARTLLRSSTFDMALIQWSLPDGSGLDLARDLESSGTASVMVTDEPNVEDALAAMRSGAADLVSVGAGCEELRRSVATAARRTRARRRSVERVERLRRVCRRLNDARQGVTDQVGSLCDDLVNAYQELADQMNQVSLASEFGSLIRQELDIEELLRTVLEFVLAKIGPTNAAVFLPSTSSDFSLGAYINYSCPKGSADVLLDHMAGVLAPAFEDERGIRVFETAEGLGELLDEDTEWMGRSRVLVFSCHHDGECLAVVTLFRDRKSDYPEDVESLCETIRDLFAQQLARVIRIHHRHLPKDQWDMFGESETDEDYGDIDMAA